jgi:hypothetical protein
MTDAEATIRASLMIGLSEHADLSGIDAEMAGKLSTDQLISDLIQAICHPSVRWALREYLEQIERER